MEEDEQSESDPDITGWDDITAVFSTPCARQKSKKPLRKNDTSETCHICCEKLNKKKCTISHHMMTHADRDASVLLPCPHCFVLFKDPNKFKFHLQTVHSDCDSDIPSTSRPILFTTGNIFQDIQEKSKVSMETMRDPLIHRKSLCVYAGFVNGNSLRSTLVDCMVKGKGGLPLVFRFTATTANGKRVVWHCPLCLTNGKWETQTEMRLFMLRHLSIHFDEYDTLEEIVTQEWKYLSEDLGGVNLERYRLTPRRVMDVQENRSLCFYTYTNPDELVQAITVHHSLVSSETLSVCMICCALVDFDRGSHFQKKHPEYKVKSTFTEFTLCSKEEESFDLSFPHPILSYSPIVKMGPGEVNDGVTFYRWFCRIPSCSNHDNYRGRSDFPYLWLLRAYALTHLYKFHPGVFSDKFYDMEWLLIHSVPFLKENEFSLRGVEEMPTDIGDPNTFVFSSSPHILSRLFRGLFICGQCFFCGLHDDFLEHIAAMHGYVNFNELLLPVSFKGVSKAISQFDRNKQSKMRWMGSILHSPRFLYGEKNTFEQLACEWNRMYERKEDLTSVISTSQYFEDKEEDVSVMPIQGSEKEKDAIEESVTSFVRIQREEEKGEASTTTQTARVELRIEKAPTTDMDMVTILDKEKGDGVYSGVEKRNGRRVEKKKEEKVIERVTTRSTSRSKTKITETVSGGMKKSVVITRIIGGPKKRGTASKLRQQSIDCFMVQRNSPSEKTVVNVDDLHTVGDEIEHGKEKDIEEIIREKVPDVLGIEVSNEDTVSMSGSLSSSLPSEYCLPRSKMDSGNMRSSQSTRSSSKGSVQRQRVEGQNGLVNETTSVSSSTGTASMMRRETMERIMQGYTWEGPPPDPVTPTQSELLDKFYRHRVCILCKEANSTSNGIRISGDKLLIETLLAHLIISHNDKEVTKQLVDRQRYELATAGKHCRRSEPYVFRLETDTNELVCSSCIGTTGKSFTRLAALRTHWEMCVRMDPLKNKERNERGVKVMKRVRKGTNEGKIQQEMNNDIPQRVKRVRVGEIGDGNRDPSLSLIHNPSTPNGEDK